MSAIDRLTKLSIDTRERQREAIIYLQFQICTFLSATKKQQSKEKEEQRRFLMSIRKNHESRAAQMVKK